VEGGNYFFFYPLDIINELQALAIFSLPKHKPNYEWIFTSIVPPSPNGK
jgi:hypothetical protein